MHVIRLSLRHIRQTFFKSLCLFLISLILVLSVNITAHLRERQTEDLSYVYRDFIVTATVSDLTGSKTDGLFISSIYISFFDDERFKLAELLKELCLKRGVTLLQADNIILSDIKASGNLVGGTRLAAFDALSPEKGVSVSFAEGYDESFFLTNKTGCLVSSTLLAVLGKSVGDTVALTVIDSLRTDTNDDLAEEKLKPEEVTADFKIIGSFLGGNAYQIYCPWEVVCDLGRESTKQPLFSEIMSATISDNYRIGELRENAALYFAKPGVISGDSDYKLGILINDEVFNTTVKELKQSIRFNN